MSLNNKNKSEHTESSPTPSRLKYIPLPVSAPDLNDKTVSIVADSNTGAPCRRCLLDAEPGERVHLMPYDPFPIDSITPFRGTGAIFLHEKDCNLFNGKVLPNDQLKRLLSVRAFDDNHMMVDAEVAEGLQLEQVAEKMLTNEKAKYIHMHYAKAGCFALRIERWLEE